MAAVGGKEEKWMGGGEIIRKEEETMGALKEGEKETVEDREMRCLPQVFVPPQL